MATDILTIIRDLNSNGECSLNQLFATVGAEKLPEIGIGTTFEHLAGRVLAFGYSHSHKKQHKREFGIFIPDVKRISTLPAGSYEVANTSYRGTIACAGQFLLFPEAAPDLIQLNYLGSDPTTWIPYWVCNDLEKSGNNGASLLGNL